MTDEHLIELVKLMRQWADACVKMLELERASLQNSTRTMCSADINLSPMRFICGHGDFAEPCNICQGTGHNAVFDHFPSAQ